MSEQMPKEKSLEEKLEVEWIKHRQAYFSGDVNSVLFIRLAKVAEEHFKDRP